MGKGKVHPSPSPPAGVCGGEMTAEAVLMRLLPAAVLAAAAPLGAEGKEVLAYLVLASLRSSTPLAKGAAEVVRAHRPELGCGCFGCYTAYWSRWDGSPEADREAIHRAIEAFEEHLAKEEVEERTGGKGRRGRKKRAATKEKDKAAAKGKGKELAVDPTPPPALLPAPEEAPKAEDINEKFNAEVELEQEDASTSAVGEDVASGSEEEKRRRGWGAVLTWRSWGLWGSH
jgi:hypothetical protein